MTEEAPTAARLRQQRDDLQLLNQLMRHDIRNDLHLIQAYARMLDGHVDEEGEQYLETIKENTESAVELTATVGDLAQVMLREEHSTARIQLDPVLSQQIEALRTAYPGAVVTIEGAVPNATVVGDGMLGSVFRNLLQNAVLHNDKSPPEIAVSAAERDGAVVVRIADNGPGVPDGRKETVFGKGEKGLESPGAGLGLYLVRSLVDGYDGEVRVEDNEPEGAVFVVRLPVAED